MKHFFYEKAKIFFGSAFAGGYAMFFYLLDAGFYTFFIKGFITISSAMVSGFFTVLVTDFYNYKLKHRIFKNKKHEEKEDFKKKGKERKRA